jgi:hypothetical protein
MLKVEKFHPKDFTVTEYAAQADFTACIAMGLKPEWQGGLCLVDTPSGPSTPKVCTCRKPAAAHQDRRSRFNKFLSIWGIGNASVGQEARGVPLDNDQNTSRLPRLKFF